MNCHACKWSDKDRLEAALQYLDDSHDLSKMEICSKITDSSQHLQGELICRCRTCGWWKDDECTRDQDKTWERAKCWVNKVETKIINKDW